MADEAAGEAAGEAAAPSLKTPDAVFSLECRSMPKYAEVCRSMPKHRPWAQALMGQISSPGGKVVVISTGMLLVVIPHLPLATYYSLLAANCSL